MSETRIQLPAGVRPPLGVYVNGVELKEGIDFRVAADELVVSRELVKEGNLGFWRWFLGAFGIGTYRKNDVVDIRYQRDGTAKIAHDVEFATPTPS
ncbi:MAG: hypothetical protein F2799_01995 [Actinobacteria bacterium]|uniref:Unannotated protein n=1 Tax=freshwater metagenome TaxID=449393 RepID=A0A6J7D1Q0_9ZZZZ|nr:hypothetical protein [Actinomycetota bacterium]